MTPYKLSLIFHILSFIQAAESMNYNVWVHKLMLIIIIMLKIIIMLVYNVNNYNINTNYVNFYNSML